MFSIADNSHETPKMKTVRFNGSLEAIAGQFVMVWVPGVDEFPMSVSFPGKRFGITYQVVGPGTRALAAMGRGDRVGIRGPYGRGFSVSGRDHLLVGGGAGMAPLAPLIQSRRPRQRIDVVIGARTKSELLFERLCERSGANVHISTDDGSKGFKGLATELAAELLSSKKYDGVYACGPEMMISSLLRIASRRKVPVQASLERIMKCGIGLCDSCAIDGLHVCTDGPVFSGKELAKLEDLGRFKRDLAGRKVPI
jgi:dihydroorotate dehydrogenase electron transfer subunit